MSNARNIRETLEYSLLEKYQTSLRKFLKIFTMVTDSAAVMAKVAHAYVSSDIHTPDESWLGCLVRYLDNIMKHCIALCTRDSILQNIASDFRAMKKTAEDANHDGWKKHLPDGFILIQEVETRFATHYSIAERFFQASSKVLTVLQTKNRPSATTAFEGMKKKTDVDGNITGFSAAERFVMHLASLWNKWTVSRYRHDQRCTLLLQCYLKQSKT